MIYRVYVAPRTYIEHTFVTARSAADTARCVVPTVRWLVGNSSPLTFVFCQNTSCIPLEYTLYIAPFFSYTALFFRQIRPFLPWRARAASPECMLVYVQKTNIHSVTFWLSVSKHIKCRYVGCFQKFFVCTFLSLSIQPPHCLTYPSPTKGGESNGPLFKGFLRG